ncbi:ROK family protein [Micromonospora cathayae]|uniref:ROK family protein n=1 Tax=Micromonospora cathayae TaxID=3028804 RepID=A0ABY7ZYB8_9ACTN|nr:ROK family protein [Micromonospora sp. HUAS 3]WDZ88000.1 ROK family protein [Micromonospora sp. HUAS 3]
MNREDAISYLGIDIGGTKVALRAEGVPGSAAGQTPVETTFRWPDGGVDADLELLSSRVDELRRRWPEPIRGVGVATPAGCDPGGTVLTWPGRPSWVGLDFTGALASLFPDLPVRWADDGDLAALAEARAAGQPDVLYLGIGTGVGGGVVLDGRSWPGPAHGSCEVGHLVVDLGGPSCDCGRRGCVQAVAAGPALLRRAGRLRGGTVTFDDLVAGVRDGADWAAATLEPAVTALAAATVSVCELAHPAVVLVGGGVAAALPELVSRLDRQVAALTRPGVRAVPVRPARLGGLSSLRGALILAGAAADDRAAGPAR